MTDDRSRIFSDFSRIVDTVFLLQTPTMDMSYKPHYCFSFWYQMFGVSDGELEVLINKEAIEGEAFQTIFIESTNIVSFQLFFSLIANLQ